MKLPKLPAATQSDDPEPCAQPGLALAAASFLTGAALSWLLLVRPLFRHIIGRG